jgi:hypothetical protein
MDTAWLRTLVVAAAALAAAGAGAGDAVRLAHLGRYQYEEMGAMRHIMSAEVVYDDWVVVSSFQVLCVIEADSLLPGQPRGCIHALPGYNATNTVTRPDGYVYVNLRLAGLAIVHLDETSLHFTPVGSISEPGVYYEKMFLDGDRLYVAAHSHGIRIYDLTDPAAPALAGSLDEGFTDAFAVAAQGGTAWVADGAGGLKVVDVSDASAPAIVAGETVATATGTSEDVLLHDGRVYVGAGGAGVAVYEGTDVGSRRTYDTPVCAKHLAVVGDHLAVADIGGLILFSIEPDGSLAPAAREQAMFRSVDGEISPRLWHGVTAWGDDRIIAANWDSLDAYALVDPAVDEQPDVTASDQRLRFAPSGGQQVVRLWNDGSGPLSVTEVVSTAPSFSAWPTQATIEPGQAIDLSVAYDGTQPGSAVVHVHSDDPDEDPLPIEVHGDTPFPDPGEPAPPFTLQSWTYDHESQTFAHDTFDLASHAGKVIYFHVFSTW